VRLGSTSWLLTTLALMSVFACSAAHASGASGVDSSTISAPDIDAKSMFFIILILAISFAWIRTLPLIDKLEAWLTRE